MNTTNSTLPLFTFTISDTILITLQTFTVLITFVLICTLILLSKQKILKYRGFLPYLSIIITWGLIIRFTVACLSFLKFSNETSFTSKFGKIYI